MNIRVWEWRLSESLARAYLSISLYTFDFSDFFSSFRRKQFVWKKAKNKKSGYIEQEGRIEKDAFERTHKNGGFWLGERDRKEEKRKFFDVDFFRKGEKKKEEELE